MAWAWIGWGIGAAACAATGPETPAEVASRVSVAPLEPIELVESFPIETPLDHADIRDAHAVWLEMISGAIASLDFAEFYASDAPGSRLSAIVSAIETAAARGVRVRFLAEQAFHKTYPETLDRLAHQPGIEVRLYNVDASMGGVLHAKYFIVDGRDAYLGSQNFDWRSLTHIQELGVRVRDARLARAYLDVFEMDWAAAGAQAAADRSATARADARPGEPAAPEGGLARGDTEARLPHLVIDALAADTVRVAPVASPRGWLPESTAWELPHLIALIDHARQRVRVQLLSYRANGRGGTSFDELEAALQRAAGRGVSVQLLLADWCKRAGTIEGLQELEPVPGIDVRLVTIPAWSGGFVPYARVIHAKYMVVDGSSAWIGTSNWERDYFYDSRNVGLIIEGGELPARLDRFFEEGWDGPYASPVDPDARYAAPHIGE